jgi:hypothetical protein
MQMTEKFPRNICVIIKSSTGRFADISIIAAGCGAMADRNDGVGNNLSRSGKMIGAPVRAAPCDAGLGSSLRIKSWDQVW